METACNLTCSIQTFDDVSVCIQYMCVFVDQYAAHEVMGTDTETVSVKLSFKRIQVFLTSECIVCSISDIFIA